MDTTKFQEVIDQAVHQAMINLSDGLSNTVHSVVKGTIAGNLSHKYNPHASQLMFDVEKPSVVMHEDYTYGINCQQLYL